MWEWKAPQAVVLQRFCRAALSLQYRHMLGLVLEERCHFRAYEQAMAAVRTTLDNLEQWQPPDIAPIRADSPRHRKRVLADTRACAARIQAACRVRLVQARTGPLLAFQRICRLQRAFRSCLARREAARRAEQHAVLRRQQEHEEAAAHIQRVYRTQKGAAGRSWVYRVQRRQRPHAASVIQVGWRYAQTRRLQAVERRVAVLATDLNRQKRAVQGLEAWYWGVLWRRRVSPLCLTLNPNQDLVSGPS